MDRNRTKRFLREGIRHLDWEGFLPCHLAWVAKPSFQNLNPEERTHHLSNLQQKLKNEQAHYPTTKSIQKGD